LKIALKANDVKRFNSILWDAFLVLKLTLPVLRNVYFCCYAATSC